MAVASTTAKLNRHQSPVVSVAVYHSEGCWPSELFRRDEVFLASRWRASLRLQPSSREEAGAKPLPHAMSSTVPSPPETFPLGGELLLLSG